MQPVESVYNMASGSKMTGALEDGDLCLSSRLTCANKTDDRDKTGQLWYVHVTVIWTLSRAFVAVFQ